MAKRISQLTQLTAALIASGDLIPVVDISAGVTKYATVADLLGISTPSGIISPYGGTTAPTGWLLCYGQAISRTDYAALFTAIGTTYGVGDGSTTFNVPDLRGRVIAGQDDMGGSSANRLTGVTGSVNGDNLGAAGGAETHTLVTAEMPAHTHDYSATSVDGGTNGSNRPNVKDHAEDRIPATQSRGGGGAHNNVQPTLILNYIIKT